MMMIPRYIARLSRSFQPAGGPGVNGYSQNDGPLTVTVLQTRTLASAAAFSEDSTGSFTSLGLFLASQKVVPMARAGPKTDF